MKYLYNFLIAVILGAIGFNLGLCWESNQFFFTFEDIGASLVIGLIPGVILFLLVLPFLIWLKKYRMSIISAVYIIGFLAVIYFTYGFLATIASV